MAEDGVVTSSQDDDKSASAPTDVVLTFQGGGAKAIVHVGALAAVEQAELKVRGVAGTSAGAIVAALAAVGYTSAEMLDSSGNTQNIIDTVGKSLGVKRPADLFSPKGWWFVRALRWGFAHKRTLVVAVAALFVIGWGLTWKDRSYGVPWFILWTGLAAFIMLKAKRGISSVFRVREFLRLALVRKLGLPDDRDVSFERLHELGGLPLKVVATNVTKRSIEVFSYDRTPLASVADAVAASICLPIIFRPWKFGFVRGRSAEAEAAPEEQEFLDGGICSNLPVWTLDRERADNAACASLGFSIATSEEVASKEGDWPAALMTSIISGSMEIHTRAVTNMINIALPTDLSLLDFDAGLTRLKSEVQAAHEAVFNAIDFELKALPRIMNSATETLANSLVSVIKDDTGVLFNGDDPFRVRVALAVKRPNTWEMWTPYHFGYGYGSGPVLDQTELFELWRDRRMILGTNEPDHNWDEDHYVICMPMFRTTDCDEGEKPLVVIVETNLEIQPSQDDMLLKSLAESVYESVVDFIQANGVYDAVQRSSRL